MERFDQFSFYEMGQSISALSRFDGEVPPGDVILEVWGARRLLRSLLDGNVIPIGISRTKCQEVVEALDAIDSEFFREKNAKGEWEFKFPASDDPPIPAWRWGALKRMLTNFETVFREEMRETATYYVPRRGIYYTPALVDSADDTFPKDLLSSIPSKARQDWKSAGRCLAFNLLSASGFHVARAVEATLEHYYQLFSGKPGETLNGWNDYIEALKKIAAKKPTPAPQAKTLAELDQMRVDYRNPIMHPRVILTEADARMLFANGESLIISMAQEIAEAARGVQPSLALIAGKEIDGTAAEVAENQEAR